MPAAKGLMVLAGGRVGPKGSDILTGWGHAQRLLFQGSDHGHLFIALERGRALPSPQKLQRGVSLPLCDSKLQRGRKHFVVLWLGLTVSELVALDCEFHSSSQSHPLSFKWDRIVRVGWSYFLPWDQLGSNKTLVD